MVFCTPTWVVSTDSVLGCAHAPTSSCVFRAPSAWRQMSSGCGLVGDRLVDPCDTTSHVTSPFTAHRILWSKTPCRFFSNVFLAAKTFMGRRLGAKKQCWKCSGVDFFIFGPGGPFAVLGARLKYSMWSQNREMNLLFQTLLFDQSLPGAHQGGVGTCTRQVFRS